MQIFEAWTNAQWIMFASFTVAGLAGVGLIATEIRRYREARRRIAAWRATSSHTIVMRLEAPPRPVVVDPTAEILEHLAEGPGSLATLASVGEGSLTRAELVDADVKAWFAEVFDVVLDDFRTAMEPAMRTARLWELQGLGNHGAALARWRINTPTGEYPIVTPRALAGALIAA